MKIVRTLFLVLLIVIAVAVVNGIFSVTMARIFLNRIEREGRYLKVGEEELFLKVLGEGKPMLMIHGFPGSHLDFSELAKLLSSNRKVYLVDLPGSGLSEASSKGDYSRKGYAELLVDLMNLLNIEKADIVGHSLGGEIALNIGYYYSERVENLILIDSYALTEQKLVPDFISSSKVLTWIAMRFYYQTYPVQRYLYTKRLGDKSYFVHEEFGKYFALVDRMSIQFLSEFIKDSDGGSLSGMLGEIDLNVLIIWGERDEILPLDYAKKISEEISGSTLKIIEGRGHAPFTDKPERVAEEILSFLE